MQEGEPESREAEQEEQEEGGGGDGTGRGGAPSRKESSVFKTDQTIWEDYYYYSIPSRME